MNATKTVIGMGYMYICDMEEGFSQKEKTNDYRARKDERPCREMD